MKNPKVKISEAEISKAIRDYLDYRRDVYYVRNNTFQGAFQRPNGTKGFIRNASIGSPDIICCVRGDFIGLEVKSLTGKLSEEQIKAKKRIEKAGGKYYVVRSIGDVEKILEDLLFIPIDIG